MQMHVLKCPNCGANLDVEDGLDTFYCKYCGYKIVLEGQSDQAYRSKENIQRMRHKERMFDKKVEYEKYKDKKKIDAKERENKDVIIRVAIGILMLAIISISTNIYFAKEKRESKEEERQLEAIIDDVKADIDDKNFDDAYVKAQSIVYTKNYSKDTEKKWDNIREELLDQIEEAEKKDTGSVSHRQKKGLLKSIFGK